MLSFLTLASSAFAADPYEGLATAEEAASSAEAQVAEAEAQLDPAEARFQATDDKAEAAAQEADAAEAKVELLESQLVSKREDAAEQLASIESEHEAAVDDHDDEVIAGLGLAIAALLTAAIALGWNTFRTSAPVAWLVGLPRSQAIGISVGGGFVLLVIGTLLTAAGSMGGVIGVAVLLLGLVLPVALLLARHSAEVQRDKEKPVFKKKRLPRWVSLVLAGVMVLFFVGSLGSALFSSAPSEPEISATLRQDAEDAEDDPAEPATAGLSSAQEKAEELAEEAAKVAHPRDEAEQVVNEAQQQLRNGRRELARAQRKARTYTRQLAAISAREEREAAAAAAQEDREIAQAEAEEPEIETGSYESCATAPSDIPVPPGSPLDGDGDGIGCES